MTVSILGWLLIFAAGVVIGVVVGGICVLVWAAYYLNPFR